MDILVSDDSDEVAMDTFYTYTMDGDAYVLEALEDGDNDTYVSDEVTNVFGTLVTTSGDIVDFEAAGAMIVDTIGGEEAIDTIAELDDMDIAIVTDGVSTIVLIYVVDIDD